jgi:uncharacterized BrkB/YihY/UPF0761 family membrane protein
MTIALIIYIISLIIIMMRVVLIKEKDLAVCATIPILNTWLVIVFIGYAITQTMKDYKQHKREKNKQMPLYEFLNSKII